MMLNVFFQFGQIFASIITILVSPSSVTNSITNNLDVTNESIKYENTLKEFRKAVTDVIDKDYESSDQYLLRWLKRSNMDVSASSEMFRQAQKWRKEYSAGILNDNETDLELKDTCYLEGVNVDGGPVVVYRMMQIDIRKQILKGHSNKIKARLFKCLEIALQQGAIAGQKKNLGIIQGVSLTNLESYNLKQHGCYQCVKFYIDLLELERLYFPMIFKYSLVINVPTIAMPVVNVLRPYFPAGLLIFGKNRTEWSQAIYRLIPKDQLHFEFGGSKTGSNV